MTYRVGVDIGGTFTDIVLLGSDGSLSTRKISSTTDDYGRAISEGVEELISDLDLSPAAIMEIVHGTTVATNAILEMKGARTALITTRGFRDVLELARIRIPKLYDLFYQKPRPLVRRRLRFEVDERIGPGGEVIEPLDRPSVERVVARLKDLEVEAVAICLLHSYANPAHERAVAAAVERALPNSFVTCSADVLPEIREYERSSTAVINSYVGPIVRRYLRRLREQLEGTGLRAPLLVMQSNGGVMTADVASDKPAHLVESGPAAGVMASSILARLGGYDDVITLDMGGTTAKASAIEGGQVTTTSDYEVGAGANISSLLVSGGGYALKLPVIDISEIGAGGGSIVWIDVGGRLQIGPQSAGAVPGPVCYDAGGETPTVTDANVALGYINPRFIAGGRVELNADKARDALLRDVASPLGLPLAEAAYGVHALASAKMVRSIKAVSTYRGRDPRDFVLFAFGGSGPIHACGMARELGMRRVVVPPAAGLFSSFGLLFSTVEHHSVQTFFRPADESAAPALSAAFANLEREALSTLASEGYERSHVSLKRSADLRYVGQGFELTVPLTDNGPVVPSEVERLVTRFGDEHLQAYGHRAPADRVEIVNVRMTAQVKRRRFPSYDPLSVLDGGTNRRSTGNREAYFGRDHGFLDTAVVARRDLVRPVSGPAIVEEYDSTCLVPPGCVASLDEQGSIVVEVD